MSKPGEPINKKVYDILWNEYQVNLVRGRLLNKGMFALQWPELVFSSNYELEETDLFAFQMLAQKMGLG